MRFSRKSAKKGKKFVQNFKIVWKRAGDSLQLSHAIKPLENALKAKRQPI